MDFPPKCGSRTLAVAAIRVDRGDMDTSTRAVRVPQSIVSVAESYGIDPADTVAAFLGGLPGEYVVLRSLDLTEFLDLVSLAPKSTRRRASVSGDAA